MNRTPARIRVVALDDAKWDLRGVQDDLSGLDDIEVIAATEDPSHFMQVIETERPEVAILDLRIHDDYEAGLKVLSEIKERFGATFCLVVTIYPALGRFVEALDRGADAFVSKQAVNEGRYRLADVIRMMVRGGRIFEGDLVTEMRQQLDLSPNPLSGPDVRHGASLSSRQVEIVQLIAEGLTTPEIAHKLVLSDNTVKAHVKNVLQQLNAKDRHHAVRIARLNGLLDRSNDLRS